MVYFKVLRGLAGWEGLLIVQEQGTYRGVAWEACSSFHSRGEFCLGHENNYCMGDGIGAAAKLLLSILCFISFSIVCRTR